MPLFPPTQPPYQNVPRTLVPLLYHLFTGAPASLSATATHLFDAVTPPPRILGADLIPRTGPFILIFNHYESTRAAAWWGPLLMARALAAQRMDAPRELRVVMTREWWYPPGTFVK